MCLSSFVQKWACFSFLYSWHHRAVIHICCKSAHKRVPPDARALMLVRFIGLVGMELNWIQDRHGVGWISYALVAIWCPTGAFRWAKHKFDSSGSLKQIMLKWEQAVRLRHLPPSFPHSSSLVTLVVDSIALLFIAPIKNTSQSWARWVGTACALERKLDVSDCFN